MKRILLFLTIMLTASTAFAQEDANLRVNQAYSVVYHDEHALYNKDGDINVLDVKMEIPEYLSFSRLKPMHAYLSKFLMQQKCDNLFQAFELFKQSLGTKVTSQFDSIPDDSRFCDIDIRLNLLDYKPGVYCSMRAAVKIDPRKNSRMKAVDMDVVFTYDLTEEQIFDMDNMFAKTRKLEALDQAVLVCAMDGKIEPNMMELLGQEGDVALSTALGNDIIYFDIQKEMFDANEKKLPNRYFLLNVPTNSMKNMLLPEARKLYKKPGKINNPLEDANYYYFGDGVVETQVDSSAAYGTHAKALSEYVSDNIIAPSYTTARKKGTVMIQYVVETDGSISNIRVVRGGAPRHGCCYR